MSDDAAVKTNPYDYMRPVTAPNLFAGRTEELRIIKEEISKLKGSTGIPPVIALSGERRVGKTSILYRIEELCKEEHIITTRLSMTESIVSDPWYFWQILFDSIIDTLHRFSIDLPLGDDSHVGFKTTKNDIPHKPSLKFPSYYASQRLTGAPLSPALVSNDVELISNQITAKGYAGLIIILDEAHLLVDLNEIQQQLRDSVTQANRTGIVFAGEPLPIDILPSKVYK